MGAEIEFPKEKLIMGVMLSQEIEVDTFLKELEKEFGAIDFVGQPYPFNFTTYYEKEMGKDLQKMIISFRDKIDPQCLPQIKHQSNQMEIRWSSNANRRINLDPGILNLNRLILATTKDRGHRLPLANAIYGELTLLFIQGAFQPLPWTYADYKTETVQSDLEKIRKSLKK